MIENPVAREYAYEHDVQRFMWEVPGYAFAESFKGFLWFGVTRWQGYTDEAPVPITHWDRFIFDPPVIRVFALDTETPEEELCARWRR